jgi:hypothetical protein
MEARYYAQVGVLSKSYGRSRSGLAEALRNGGLLPPAASPKIEPGLVKARGKSGTSLHFFANRCSAHGQPEVLVRMI